jgi:hypothetical protein
MTQTQSLEALYETLLTSVALNTGRERILNRIEVAVCYQQKLFIAEPRRGRIRLRFGRQCMGSPSLMDYIEEALRAAEALAYGITSAAAIRLDAETRRWYEWELNQHEQGSD